MTDYLPYLIAAYALGGWASHIYAVRQQPEVSDAVKSVATTFSLFWPVSSLLILWCRVWPAPKDKP